MTDASRDQNRVPTILGVSNADGLTPITIYASPTTHAVQLDGMPSGTMPINATAPRDQNRIPVVIGVSSVDQETPVIIGVESTTHQLFVEVT